MTYFIAHRGLHSKACENTVNAFELAAKSGYYGVECDVHVTSDEKFAVFHDDTTGRICVKDISLEGATLKQLKSLSFKNGKEYKIPTLQEYLSAIAAYGTTAVIELKNPMNPQHILQITEICKEYVSLDKVIFISFCIDNLITVRNILPGQKIQLLTCSLTDDIIAALKKYNFGADADRIIVTKELVEKLHSYNIPVNVWTCNDAEEAAQFIRWGVDFITTDFLSEKDFK